MGGNRKDDMEQGAFREGGMWWWIRSIKDRRGAEGSGGEERKYSEMQEERNKTGTKTSWRDDRGEGQEWSVDGVASLPVHDKNSFFNFKLNHLSECEQCPKLTREGKLRYKKKQKNKPHVLNAGYQNMYAAV